MDTLIQDLRYATRTLMRTRGVSALAVLALTVGIGATAIAFSVAYAALLRPVPFADPDRLAIVYITHTTPRDGEQRLRWSKPGVDLLRGTTHAFESLASFSGTNITMSRAHDSGDLPEQTEGEIVSPAFFRTLRIDPIMGRTFQPEEDDPARPTPIVVLSERLWRTRLGADPDILNTTIRINDVPLTVIGVLPASFAGLSGRASLWLPTAMAPQLTYSEYLTTPQHFISVIGRLSPGVTMAQADAELRASGHRFADVNSRTGGTWGATARPIGEARIDATLRQSATAALAAAACVLLIGCANVASLLLARARTRRREIAVRLAIGCSRARLVRQLLTEAGLLAAIAGAGGVMAAALGLRILTGDPAIIATWANDYGAIGAFAAPALEPRVIAFAVAATAATAILFGLAPALAALRPAMTNALRTDERGGGRFRSLAGLVVGEVAGAVLLLGVAGMFVEAFVRLHALEIGFDPDRVLTFSVRPPNSHYRPEDGPTIVSRLLASVQEAAGVESAAVNRCAPFVGCSRTSVFFRGRPVDPLTAPGVGRHYVSADYFRTLGIPVREGRALTPDDRAGRPPVTVISAEAARRFWPGEDPIGKYVWFGSATGFTDPNKPVEVVGVVGDVKYEAADIDVQSRGEFYTSYLQFSFPDTMMIVKTRASPADVVPALRAAVASVDASLAIYDVQTLDQRVAGAVRRPRSSMAVIAALAGAAVLMAAMGVYGMLSYAVSARLREVGIRMALGADAGRVLRLVIGHGLRMAVIGGLIGVAGGLVLGRVVRALVTTNAPADWRVPLAAAAAMALVACAAAWIPARRASRVDPAIVLKSD